MNNIDLISSHTHSTQVPDSPRVCPCCNTNMVTINTAQKGEEPFLIEQCSSCFSLFFDPGELESILEKKVEKVITIDHQLLNSITNESFDTEKVVYRKCPECLGIMNRKSFGTRSGVVVDHCKNHGVFLDSGELNKLVDWRKAGGQLLDEQRKEERTAKASKIMESKLSQLQNKRLKEGYQSRIYFSPRKNHVSVLDFICDLF